MNIKNTASSSRLLFEIMSIKVQSSAVDAVGKTQIQRMHRTELYATRVKSSGQHQRALDATYEIGLGRLIIAQINIK